MAINFGEQISAGLESAYRGADRGRQRALQAQRLNQQLEEFQWKKQMDQLVNRVKQKQMQIDQEVRMEDLAQQHIENELDRDKLEIERQREDRLATEEENMNKYREWRMENAGSSGGGSGSGGSDDDGISGADYSDIQRINSGLGDLAKEKRKAVNELIENNNAGAGGFAINTGKSRSLTEKINYINQQMEQLNAEKAGILGNDPQPTQQQSQQQTSSSSSSGGSQDNSSGNSGGALLDDPTNL